MDKRVTLGKIGAPHGIRGWVKVFSSTYPADEILNYDCWQVERQGVWQELVVEQLRPMGKGFIAQIRDSTGQIIDDRDVAATWCKAEIAVWRSEMPELDEDEVYWADLIGLAVETVEGKALGKIQQMMETGANDVLVVHGERERLIPFVRGMYVKEVDLERGLVRVDWDPDF